MQYFSCPKKAFLSREANTKPNSEQTICTLPALCTLSSFVSPPHLGPWWVQIRSFQISLGDDGECALHGNLYPGGIQGLPPSLGIVYFLKRPIPGATVIWNGQPRQIKSWPASLRPIVLKPMIGLRDRFWEEKDSLVGYNTARWEATSIVSSRSLRGWETARWMRHVCHYGEGLSQNCMCYAMNVYREEYLLPGVQGKEGLWTVWPQVRPWGRYKGSLDGNLPKLRKEDE